MIKNLSGKKIMILRPAGQSEELCRLVSNSGGEVVRFPTLKIVPIKKYSVDDLKELIKWCQIIIFISRNSVLILSELLSGLKEELEDKVVFAAGDGTAGEARVSGVKQAISPVAQSGSEALLQLTDLQSVAILDKNILIVRGDSGREFLKQELEARGAVVKYAEIYTRAIPNISPEDMDKIWMQGSSDIIVITSNQGLYNLINMTPARYHDRLFRTDIVAMSERIAKTARKEGFMKKLAVAETQTDQGLHDAVLNILE